MMMTVTSFLGIFILPAVVFAVSVCAAREAPDEKRPDTVQEGRRSTTAVRRGSRRSARRHDLPDVSEFGVGRVAGMRRRLPAVSRWGPGAVAREVFHGPDGDRSRDRPSRDVCRLFRRNALLLLPGANVVAIFLEGKTIVMDPLGQRLGDRLALTQVVDALGARDVVNAFQEWLRSLGGGLGRAARRPGYRPAEADRRTRCAASLRYSLSHSACCRDGPPGA